ncbi:MAG: gephyrin-like molybdotransferase Glp [Acidobacteriota bacterium]
MRPDVFGELVSFDEALRRALAAARPIARRETTSLADARDRVVATAVIATLDVPPFDRSAMDGYAIRATDLPAAGGPTTLPCVDRIFTGEVSRRVLGEGECIEISTGAPMPAGADAVVMVERTTRSGDQVTFAGRAAVGQNIGRRGADLRANQAIVHPGDVLTPARIGALAAAGVTNVEIFERPTVAIVSTGNEVTSPGDALPPGHVYDVNRFTLRAVAEDHGCTAVLTPRVGDVIEDLVHALRAAATHDVIVCSGGSSVGGRDLLVDAVRALGSIVFHGVAMKPGKPTLLGSIDATPVFGMPGNPTSCLSNAYLLLMPFLRATARLPPWRPMRLTLPLASDIRASSDRHQFFTVRIADGAVQPAFKSSGDITSMAAADGYIEIPVGTASLSAGTSVVVTLF